MKSAFWRRSQRMNRGPQMMQQKKLSGIAATTWNDGNVKTRKNQPDVSPNFNSSWRGGDNGHSVKKGAASGLIP